MRASRARASEWAGAASTTFSTCSLAAARSPSCRLTAASAMRTGSDGRSLASLSSAAAASSYRPNAMLFWMRAGDGGLGQHVLDATTRNEGRYAYSAAASQTSERSRDIYRDRFDITVAQRPQRRGRRQTVRCSGGADDEDLVDALPVDVDDLEAPEAVVETIRRSSAGAASGRARSRPPCDSRGSVGSAMPSRSAELVDRVAAVDQQRAVVALHDVGLIVFLDVGDDGLEDVAFGDDALDAAVLVDDQHQVRAATGAAARPRRSRASRSLTAGTFSHQRPHRR